MTTSSWSTIDPWEKAARWLKVAPELANDIVSFAKIQAEHRMDLERKSHAHQMEQQRLAAMQKALMDTRLWYTQLFAMSINVISLVILVIIAAKFGKDGILPALTVLGAGGGLTAGSLAVSSLIRKQWRATPGLADAIPIGDTQPTSTIASQSVSS